MFSNGISAAKKKEEIQIAGSEESTGLPILHHELVGPNMVLVWFGNGTPFSGFPMGQLQEGSRNSPGRFLEGFYSVDIVLIRF